MNIFKSTLILAGISAFSFNTVQANDIVKLKIKETKVNCDDQQNQSCLQVKEGCGSWKTLSSHIEGFNYVEGTRYTIKAKKKEEIVSTTKNANNNKYELVSILKSKPVLNALPLASSTKSMKSTISNNKLFIKKVNGQSLKVTDAFMSFNLVDNRIHAFTGCNTLNSNVTISGNQVKFGPAMMTMRGCLDQDIQNAENLINKALNETTYTYHQSGNQVWLADANGKRIVEMEEQTADAKIKAATNTKWELTSLNNVGQDYQGVYITFDTSIKKVTGNTSCNAFNADMKITGETIYIGHIMQTLRGCLDEKSEIETAFTDAIKDKTFTYDVDDNNLSLYRDNKRIATFQKVN